MTSALAAALLTWTLPPGGAVPDGFRVYRCENGDPGLLTVHREVVESHQVEVEPGLYRVTALYHGAPVTDGDGFESPGTVESSLSEPIATTATPEPEPEPEPAPARVVVEIWSSPDLTREAARVEAVIYHIPTKPARFWWADIRQE